MAAFSPPNGRREALYLALAAAETCWFAPLFLALIRSSAPHPPLLLWLGVWVLLAGFAYLYRALERSDLDLRVQQGLLVAVLLLGIGLFLRFHLYARSELPGLQWLWQPFRRFADLSNLLTPELVLVLSLIYLWARGIHLARRSLSVDSVGFSFRAGVLIWIWIAPLVAYLGQQDVAPYIVAFFFFSLLAVALSRVEAVSRLPGSGRIGFSGFWIVSTVAAVAVLVFLGSLLANFFYGGGLRAVLGWFSPLLVVVQVIILILVWLIFGLLQWIFALLEIDWQVIGARFREILEGFSDLGEPFARPPGEQAESARRVLEMLQASTIMVVIVVSILLVLLFTWWRVRRARIRAGEDSRESLLTGRGLARNLLAGLQAGRDRIRDLAGLVDRFGLGSQLLSAISIRRIYANLVRLATRAGYPRARSQTPYEYLETLCRALPDHGDDVRVITNAYVNAHYGQVPESRDELQRIRTCWERIRAQGVERRQAAGEGASGVRR